MVYCKIGAEDDNAMSANVISDGNNPTQPMRMKEIEKQKQDCARINFVDDDVNEQSLKANKSIHQSIN